MMLWRRLSLFFRLDWRCTCRGRSRRGYVVTGLFFGANQVEHFQRYAVGPAETILQRILTAATAGSSGAHVILLNQLFLAIVGVLNIGEESPGHVHGGSILTVIL